jgi:hypothetical protein
LIFSSWITCAKSNGAYGHAAKGYASHGDASNGNASHGHAAENATTTATIIAGFKIQTSSLKWWTFNVFLTI